MVENFPVIALLGPEINQCGLTDMSDKELTKKELSERLWVELAFRQSPIGLVLLNS